MKQQKRGSLREIVNRPKWSPEPMGELARIGEAWRECESRASLVSRTSNPRCGWYLDRLLNSPNCGHSSAAA